MCQEEESTYLPEIIWFYLLMENAGMKPVKGFPYITLGWIAEVPFKCLMMNDF